MFLPEISYLTRPHLKIKIKQIKKYSTVEVLFIRHLSRSSRLLCTVHAIYLDIHIHYSHIGYINDHMIQNAC